MGSPIAVPGRKVMAKVRLASVASFGAAIAVLCGSPSLVSPGRAEPVIGPDAAMCATGKTALLVRVHGFKGREGLLRVSTFIATESDWMVKGRYIRRIDVAVPPSGSAHVCIGLPRAGDYGVAVLHDRNGDHKASIWSDGGGFSNNPKLGFSKPKVDKVAFVAGTGLTTIDIQLRYL